MARLVLFFFIEASRHSDVEEHSAKAKNVRFTETGASFLNPTWCCDFLPRTSLGLANYLPCQATQVHALRPSEIPPRCNPEL
jgi:hypothetical protein